jgi:hypothetical protein
MKNAKSGEIIGNHRHEKWRGVAAAEMTKYRQRRRHQRINRRNQRIYRRNGERINGMAKAMVIRLKWRRRASAAARSVSA